MMYFGISNPYFTFHNNSGEQIRHYHDIHPTFRLLVSNTNDTVPFYWSPFQLRDLSSSQCVHNSTTYLIVSLDVVLSSDSLYHLGDQVVYFWGYGYNHFQGFRAKIYVRVQAGMFKGIYPCKLTKLLAKF